MSDRVQEIIAVAIGEPCAWLKRQYTLPGEQSELFTHWQARAVLEALRQSGYRVVGPFGDLAEGEDVGEEG